MRACSVLHLHHSKRWSKSSCISVSGRAFLKNKIFFSSFTHSTSTHTESEWEWSGGSMRIYVIKKVPLDFKSFGYLSSLSCCFICFNTVQTLFYNYGCTVVIYLKLIKLHFICLECRSYS